MVRTQKFHLSHYFDQKQGTIHFVNLLVTAIPLERKSGLVLPTTVLKPSCMAEKFPLANILNEAAILFVVVNMSDFPDVFPGLTQFPRVCLVKLTKSIWCSHLHEEMSGLFRVFSLVFINFSFFRELACDSSRSNSDTVVGKPQLGKSNQLRREKFDSVG